MSVDETSTLEVQYSKDGGTTWVTASTSNGTVIQDHSASAISEPNYNDYYHMTGVELNAGDSWPIYRVKTTTDSNE